MIGAGQRRLKSDARDWQVSGIVIFEIIQFKRNPGLAGSRVTPPSMSKLNPGVKATGSPPGVERTKGFPK